MEDKLLEIAKLMNDFSKKYGCAIDVEIYIAKSLEGEESNIVYKLKAVRREGILEVIN